MSPEQVDRLIAKIKALGPIPNATILLTRLADAPFLRDWAPGEEPPWRVAVVIMLIANPHISVEDVTRELESRSVEQA